MAEWCTPEFEEIRMDAEINCYCSVLADAGATALPPPAAAGAEPVARRDARASS